MSIRKYRFHIALVAIIIIGISLACIVLIYTDTEKFTLLGIIIAIVTFVFDRVYEHKKNTDDVRERMSRCYATIIKELEDHSNAFKKPEFNEITDNKVFPFKSMFLNVDAYESLLNSGLYTRFPELFQIGLANLYIIIKLHNKYQIQRSLLRGMFLIERHDNNRSDWPLVCLDCDEILSRYQKEIRDFTEIMKTLAEQEKEDLN